MVEQGTENPRVVGSIPTGGTIYADLAHLVERNLAKVEVAGSSPVIRSTKKQHPHGCCFLNKIIRRHGQVVRHRSAKPLFLGPNPSGASKTKSTAIAVLFVLEMLPHPSATSVDGSNLETTEKRLSIVFSKFLSPKQGALRVECIETKKGDYATRAKWAPQALYKHIILCYNKTNNTKGGAI